MKLQSKWPILIGAAVLAGLFAAFGLNRSAQAQHFTAKTERGDIHDVVDATGTINAVITVQVGSQVSGTIAKLNADFNSRVHKGDIVALIDPALFQGALLQASADLDNAKANLVAAKDNLEKVKATSLQTKDDYDRTALLTTDKITSQQQLDLAKANYDSANAAVGAAAANVTQAEAQVSQKAAALTVAQTNLNYTVIRSPIDGTVVARNVDVGQTVAASLQAPTIFTIAQDLTKMLVYAKTDEAAAAERGAPPAGTPQNPPRAPRSDSAVVWKLHADNSMEPVKVTLGITDHAYTEIAGFVKGELKEGDELIVRSVVPKSTAPGGPGIRR